ncbi:B-cell receptor-associated protein 31-like-domain-containing protein [Phycomyces blakesleeanus]|uniref:Endoplasmic reticulum transmembrane protein n=2 Tax=Phycomyces blakesleeanus TaxID=4837 RepID=A0A163AT55_PHYB8|nr:hypothetical protein PHYBLDRAFT_180844 [Phycomyces blakesleeanus NRRL 1555(-)]OAD75611.1 hypothetical protein PHYBLDRAFT_180844 [Phycomyces blakesleeanus NRRL 1555(-)]|eukprot:XP_018293651.1 hypothetical protein PHYBLDRAFT_180844 [Phycomyces blakesleeanus NRRL 1555(-)]
MAIYYTLTFAILVTEMVIFGILVMPLPSRWRRAMMKGLTSSPLIGKALYGLKIAFGFIFLLFLDTVNRLQRIGSDVTEEQRHHHDFGFEANLKATTFYTQRNLYLTGFTLFLSLILDRTSTLVIEVLKREEELESVKKDAVSANNDSKRLVDIEKEFQVKITELNNELKQLKQQERDFETLKKQADQQQKEYNRLSDERNALENSISGLKSESRKDL